MADQTTKPARTFNGTKMALAAALILAGCAAPWVYLVVQADIADYDLAFHVSRVKVNEGQPTTEDLAAGALPYYMQPEFAPEPTALDVLSQAASTAPPAARERMAGVFRNALGLMRQTRIGSVEELNQYLGANIPASVGSQYGQAQPFMQAWSRMANELMESGQLNPNDTQALGEFIEGTEQLLRGGP